MTPLGSFLVVKVTMCWETSHVHISWRCVQLVCSLAIKPGQIPQTASCSWCDRNIFNARVTSWHHFSPLVDTHSPCPSDKPVCSPCGWFSLIAPLSFGTRGIYFHVACFLLSLYQLTPFLSTSVWNRVRF